MTDTWRYQAFGETRARTGSSANPFGFVGELGYYQEAGLGLHYVRARWYEARTGRWVSEDPVEGGANAYVYSHNRPGSCVDASGLDDACRVGQIRTVPTEVVGEGVYDTSEPVADVSYIIGATCNYVYYSGAKWYEKIQQCQPAPTPAGPDFYGCIAVYRPPLQTKWVRVGGRYCRGRLKILRCRLVGGTVIEHPVGAGGPVKCSKWYE